MGYKDKLKRLEEARNTDEKPLVGVLNSVTTGHAWINKKGGGMTNRAQGDVLWRQRDGAHVNAFESQVSRTHQAFSYTKSKLYDFEGVDGGPRWVLLGCLDIDDNAGGMFYVLVSADILEELVRQDYEGVTDHEKFFVIRPEVFMNVDEKWTGNTLEEVISDWWRDDRRP